MLRSTFVALSAAVIARACRNDAVFACIRSTVATMAVLFVVEDVSMSWCDRLGRVASVWSAAAVLPLLGRLVVGEGLGSVRWSITFLSGKMLLGLLAKLHLQHILDHLIEDCRTII